MRLFVLAFMACLIPMLAEAHGGRTAADGCHRDTKNGGRHCHNSGTARAATATPSTTRTNGGDLTLGATTYRQAPTEDLARPEPQEWVQEPKPSVTPKRAARAAVPSDAYQEESMEMAPITRNAYYFAHCHEMVRMGLAPMKRGDDGYREALDFNGNGIACEEGEY